MTRKNKNKRNNKNNSRVAMATFRHPPQVDLNIRWNKRFRWTATTAQSATSITSQSLLDSFLTASTAISGYQFFDTVRIKAVEVWGPSPAAGTAVTVAVTFISSLTPTLGPSLNGDEMIHSDTSVSIEPAHVLARPRPESLPARFVSGNTGGGTTLFFLTCPVGSVIDIDLEGITTPGLGTPVMCGQALVAATAGNFYYRGLDGLAIAGTQIPPALVAQAR